ncbi:DUF4190 domain-containing protein [Streptomyces sp. enrichment culture]|uniref:DUF4190 domain-containing protein n=1 Tax=Streptomyces sp. enrichment culture TaxID=1795815 RepID=UPI003F57C505
MSEDAPPENNAASAGAPWPAQGTPGAAGSPADRDPWAPPAGDAPGPGHTIASGSMPIVNPSVHDQQTITSLPSMGGATPWDGPSPQTSGAFPPPAPGPFAPPTDPVPPPPLSPDGPGQPPYAYPAAGGAYGYPPAAQPPAGYYGWPGAVPAPSNGMGTTALVLGIIADVLFLLWPIAILLGILAVIFGAVGRGKAKHGEATNAGQALAGLICGIVGIVLGLGFGALILSEA